MGHCMLLQQITPWKHKYKSNDALYCTATDVEFIKLLDGLNKPTSDCELGALQTLMPLAAILAPTVGSDEQMFEIGMASGIIVSLGSN